MTNDTFDLYSSDWLRVRTMLLYFLMCVFVCV